MNFRKFILGSSSPRKKSKTGLMTLIDFQVASYIMVYAQQKKSCRMKFNIRS